MKRVLKKIRNLARRISIMKNWYAFMWPLSHFGSWPRVARLRSGANILIKAFRSSDYAIFNELVIDDVYRIAAYKNPKKIIDVGANIGIFSVVVAKMFPVATVIAIEPDDKNFNALKQNISLSNASNVTPVKKAVASKKGTAILYVYPDNPGMNSLHYRAKETREDTHEVETVPLTDFLPSDVLKIDAEGAEYDIFKNYVPDCDIIAMELHGQEKDSLLRKLSSKYEISSQDTIHILRRKPI